jgi:hypothetical protein
MAPRSRKISRVLAFAAGPIAVVAAGAMVMQGSYAAFEAETRNAGNSWSSGTVTLTNDLGGTARFTATAIKPGSTDTKCIKVTSGSTVAGTVKFYFLNPTSSSATGLENYLNMKIESGDGGDGTSCTGFIADTQGTDGVLYDGTLYTGASTVHTYATAVGSWAPNPAAQPTSKTYRFTWTLDALVPDTLQNARYGIDFEWEMQTSP